MSILYDSYEADAGEIRVKRRNSYAYLSSREASVTRASHGASAFHLVPRQRPRKWHARPPRAGRCSAAAPRRIGSNSPSCQEYALVLNPDALVALVRRVCSSASRYRSAAGARRGNSRLTAYRGANAFPSGPALFQMLRVLKSQNKTDPLHTHKLREIMILHGAASR